MLRIDSLIGPCLVLLRPSSLSPLFLLRQFHCNSSLPFGGRKKCPACGWHNDNQVPSAAQASQFHLIVLRIGRGCGLRHEGTLRGKKGKLRLPEHLSNAIVQQSFQLANVDCHILTHPTLKSPFITSIFMRSRRIFSDLSLSKHGCDRLAGWR